MDRAAFISEQLFFSAGFPTKNEQENDSISCFLVEC